MHRGVAMKPRFFLGIFIAGMITSCGSPKVAPKSPSAPARAAEQEIEQKRRISEQYDACIDNAFDRQVEYARTIGLNPIVRTINGTRVMSIQQSGGQEVDFNAIAAKHQKVKDFNEAQHNRCKQERDQALDGL